MQERPWGVVLREFGRACWAHSRAGSHRPRRGTFGERVRYRFKKERHHE